VSPRRRLQGMRSSQSPWLGFPSPGTDLGAARQLVASDGWTPSPRARLVGGEAIRRDLLNSRRTPSRGTRSGGPERRKEAAPTEPPSAIGSRVSDTRGCESWVSDTRSCESWVSDTRGCESRVSDTRGCESRVSDTCGCESRVSDTRGCESWVSDTRGCESWVSDTRGCESRVSDTRGCESRVSDTRGCES